MRLQSESACAAVSGPYDAHAKMTPRVGPDFSSVKGAGNIAFPTYFPVFSYEKVSRDVSLAFPQSFAKQLLLHRKLSDVITTFDLYFVRWRSLDLCLS